MKYFLSNDQVDLAINGPREAASAEKVTYALTYTNGNRAALKDAKLLVTFPDNFLPDAEEGFIMEGSRGEKALGEVLAGQGGTQSISGTFFGPKGRLGDSTGNASVYSYRFFERFRDRCGIFGDDRYFAAYHRN